MVGAVQVLRPESSYCHFLLHVRRLGADVDVVGVKEEPDLDGTVLDAGVAGRLLAAAAVVLPEGHLGRPDLHVERVESWPVL